ncbi:MauE/DoxX family redox-associated membrane protein [Bacteroidota bacterium]
MKAIIGNKYFLLIARILLGFTFIIAGIEKISYPEDFATSISNYKVFPIYSINIIAITIPWIELISGLLILYGIAIKENAFIINILLITFIMLIMMAIMRGLDIECGCFGTRYGQKVGILKILENSGFLFLGLMIMFFDSNKVTMFDNIKK